jgi:1-acyl-sn-glycerol-3-phosphate acyltransferase
MKLLCYNPPVAMRAAFLLLFYTLIVILMAPVLLICWALGMQKPVWVISKWAMRVGQRILGISVEISGLERFDPMSSYVFMPNHLSILDGPLMVMVTPQPVRVIIKKSIFRIPILGWTMRYVGCVPVDRKGESGGRGSIEKASGLMRERGYSFLIFPEGTRSVDGKLHRFRRGGFFLAIAGGAPIVPVTIRGTFELMPKGRFGAKRGKVSVIFHPPVPVDGYSERNVAELVEKVTAAVSSGF